MEPQIKTDKIKDISSSIAPQSKNISKDWLTYYYNNFKIFMEELKQGLIWLTLFFFTPLKMLTEYLTFPLLFRYITIFLLFSKIMAIPSMSFIIGSSLSNFFCSVIEVYSGFYNEVFNGITTLRNDVKELTGLRQTNLSLLDRIQADHSLRDALIEERQKIIASKDSEISFLNLELNKKQIAIGELNSKNQLLLKDSNYVKLMLVLVLYAVVAYYDPQS